MVNVTCNGMRILVVFVDVYEKCDQLLFGFVFVYGHSVCRGHYVSQWTQVSIGLNFSVCMCYLVKQKQKQSRKCGPCCVCCISKAKQKHASVYSFVFVVYNSFIVNCIHIKW